jgi:Protein of unknown function (DUF1279)
VKKSENIQPIPTTTKNIQPEVATTEPEKKKLEVNEVTIDALEEAKHLGLFARFKKMAKDYWYVLIPVHVATSCVWLGAFYYTSKR